MATARRGSSVKKGLKFFVYGKQGTRKSSYALDFMKMTNEEGKPLRVFYLDTEFGSIDNYLEMLEEQGVDLGNLFIVYGNTYSEAEEWLDKVVSDEDLYYEDENGEEVLMLDADGEPFRADVIVVDSITPIMDTVKYGMINTSEKRARLRAQKKENTTATEVFVAEATAGMEFKDYDKLQSKGKNLLRSLITRTSKYVCVIAREKDKKEQRKTNDGFTSVKVGVMPDAPKDAEFEFFTVVHMMDDEETGEIVGEIEQKDRTLTFNRGELIDNPSPLMWQSVITKNKGKKGVSVQTKKYEEIVEEESQSQYSSSKNSTEKVSNSDMFDVESPQGIVDAITSIRKNLLPTKKQLLSSKYSENGYPKRPTVKEPLDVLKAMLELAKEIENQ